MIKLFGDHFVSKELIYWLSRQAFPVHNLCLLSGLFYKSRLRPFCCQVNWNTNFIISFSVFLMEHPDWKHRHVSSSSSGPVTNRLEDADKRQAALRAHAGPSRFLRGKTLPAPSDRQEFYSESAHHHLHPEAFSSRWPAACWSTQGELKRQGLMQLFLTQLNLHGALVLPQL